MRCSACNNEFSAAWAQPSPGGSSAPGVFLIVTIFILALAILLGRLGVASWPWVLVAVAAFVGIQVLVAWSDCGKRGGHCPECETAHPVRPWSL
jgi:hypothetical protein